MRRSGDQWPKIFSASAPSRAVRTSYPREDSAVFSTRVIWGSSSTTRILRGPSSVMRARVPA